MTIIIRWIKTMCGLFGTRISSNRGLAVCLFLLAAPLTAGELADGEMETSLVPGPLKYSVLLPDGYDAATEPFPLVLNLHGGGGTRDSLGRMRKFFEDPWKAATLPKMVVVTPGAERSFYMD